MAQELAHSMVSAVPASLSESTSSHRQSNSSSHRHSNDDDDDDDVSMAPSMATTALATEVGSMVGAPKDAFLRSVTFHKGSLPAGMGWSMEIADPKLLSGRPHKSKKDKLTVKSIGGVVALSTIQVGDVINTINGKRIGPSYNAERTMDLLQECYEKDEYLSITCGNAEGNDIYVEATIVKPRPETTFKELGIVVWYWGQLCIKSIGKDSILRKTVLQSTDHIVSVNDIICQKMTAEGFEHVINELPQEITIVVQRGKQRWTGRFG